MNVLCGLHSYIVYSFLYLGALFSVLSIKNTYVMFFFMNNTHVMFLMVNNTYVMLVSELVDIVACSLPVNLLIYIIFKMGSQLQCSS